MITLNHITKDFQHFNKQHQRELKRALSDINLTIPTGCVFGLLGVNGAGKTTLVNLIEIDSLDVARSLFGQHI